MNEIPLTMEALRDLVREECRLAVRQEIEAVLIRALSPPAPEGPEPATWGMGVAKVVEIVAELTERALVREVLAYERQHPDGPRPGVISACEVRLTELEG